MKIIVSKNENDNPDYYTISEAIENCKDLDIIFIKAGYYHEYFTISKNIKIIGEDNVYIYNNNDEKLQTTIFINESCELNNLNIISNNSTTIHIFSSFDISIKNCSISSNNNLAFLIMGSGDFIIDNCIIKSQEYCIQYSSLNIFETSGEINNCNLQTNDSCNILLSKNAILKINNSNLISKKNNIILREEAQLYLNKCNLKSDTCNIILREKAFKKNVILDKTTVSIGES